MEQNREDITEMESLFVTIIDQETQKTISGTLTEVNNQFCSISPRLSIKDDILKLVELLDRHDISLLTLDCTFGCVVKTRVSPPSHVVDEAIEYVTSLAWKIESFFLRHPVTEGNVVPTDYIIVRVRNPNMLMILHNVAIDNA